MMSEDFERGQQIGEILASLKGLERTIAENAAESVEDRRRIRESVVRLQENIIEIENKLSTARFMWMFLRACAITVFMLFTLKVGDIGGVWKGLFK